MLRGHFSWTGSSVLFATLALSIASSAHAAEMTATTSTAASAPSSATSGSAMTVLSPEASTSNDASTLSAKPKEENKKFPDDSGITDPKLRAEQGSLRRYSGKFNFGYMGPVIGDLSNPYQPNPDGSVTHNPTNLRGNMAFRYRLSSDSALNFGTGISRIRPFDDAARTDVSTPFVSYDISFRARAWQFRSAVSTSLVTTPEYRNVGQVAGLSLSQSVYRNINHTRWLAGVDSSFGTSVYNRPYRAGPTAGPLPTNPAIAGTRPHHHNSAASHFAAGDGNASSFNLNFYPTIKYRFNDTVGTYTSLAIEYYEPRSALGKMAIRDKTLSQRLGFEYSVTHDIYISPFIAVYPAEISINSTTINFTTVFSVL